MMDRRFSRVSSRESTTLERKIVESQRPNKNKPAPDLTDFMNDMFFGTLDAHKKSYNLTGSGFEDEEEEESFDDSTRSNSSKLTQEWLEEARRMVASSPTRCDSPSRLVGSPRFAAAPGRLSVSTLDRRDPLSRSARRHRSVEGLSGEILTKSEKHSRNKSESLDNTQPSPASKVQNWFSNILKPSNSISPPDQSHNHHTPSFDPKAPTLPPRLSTSRRSRFQTEPTASPPQGIPVPSRRSFKPTPLPADTHLLSPPKNLIESAHRRSISSSTCSQLENQHLSSPRNPMESTCSTDKIAQKASANNGWHKEEEGGLDPCLNGFLKEQKTMIEKILCQEVDYKAKIILSGPSNSTSSMVAAICYAWLLQDRYKKNKGEGDGQRYVVVPVMNVKRVKMWKQIQAAWLFHHVGLDATSLLFADEVGLESLMMEGKLNVLVVGQDILKTNNEVGSQCTILTDNFCEDAYDLLQIPVLKKLLLAGILLDTKNLNASTTLSMTRDAEAVQLLLVGSAPNYRNALFDELMQDQGDNSFVEALRHNYGKPPSESGSDSGGAQMYHSGTERKSTSVSHHHEAITQNSEKNSNNVNNGKNNKDAPKSAKPNAVPAKAAMPVQPENSRGKNKFFLAKWFSFGSK